MEEPVYEVDQIGEIIHRAVTQKYGECSHLKLQKLLYYTYGVFLTFRKRKLFDAPIEAWKFGPVIPEVFHQFKKYGADNIEEWESWRNHRFEVDRELKKEIEKFAKSMGRHTAGVLSAMSHRRIEPWGIINEQKEGQIPRGTDLPDSLIIETFPKLFKEVKDEDEQ